MKWEIKSFYEMVWDKEQKRVLNPELEKYMNQGWEPFAIHFDFLCGMRIYIKKCTQESCDAKEFLVEVNDLVKAYEKI